MSNEVGQGEMNFGSSAKTAGYQLREQRQHW